MLEQKEIQERCRKCGKNLFITYVGTNGGSYALECFERECGFFEEITKEEYETFKRFPKIHSN